MLSRVALPLITLFWVTMNVLLWRSEFGGKQLGGAVAVAVAWQKILTSPDASSLDIVHHGKRIGECRWTAGVREELALRNEAGAASSPEGLVEHLSGYRITFAGSVRSGEAATRLHFDANLKLATNQLWQEVRLRIDVRPTRWVIHSIANEQTIRLKVEDDRGESERVFNFADLQHPERLAREFAGPWAAGLLATMGLPANSTNAPSLKLGLTWEAHNDWFPIGHTPVRAYRLQTKILDRYKIILIVSRIGEILRVELPDNLVLANNELGGM